MKVISHAVDISKHILEVAEKGVYSLEAPELVEAPIFARVNAEEMQEMFDIDPEAGEARVKSWIKDGITWHLADAGSPAILDALEPQDMVLANNFLCHMDPSIAEMCLRNIARLVNPGGYLVISGVDLDVRTRVALDLGWKPVPDLMEDIHEGDPSVRNDWPCEYWGLEPLDKTRPDRVVRYSAVFQLA